MMPSTIPTVSWTGVSRVILGSKSWSRRMLLGQLEPPGLDYVVADIDEHAAAKDCGDAARDIVSKVGIAKARAIMSKPSLLRPVLSAPKEEKSTATDDPDAFENQDDMDADDDDDDDDGHDSMTNSSDGGTVLLICGDALVTHGGKVVGKPANRDEARTWLKSYGGGLPVTTVSSIVITDVRQNVFWSGVDEAEVYFRPLGEAVIEKVLDDGALQSAGALRIEHPDIQPFIECIVGDISAVMGFSQPLCAQLVTDALNDTGVSTQL